MKAQPRVAAQAPDEGVSVGYLITRARTCLLSGLDTELEPYGLNGAQFSVLKHLADCAESTASDLCRSMHYDTGSMTRLLDRLEQKGLLRRERCKTDRRMVYLRLTSAGRAQLPRLRTAAVRVLERHLAGFTPIEIEDLKLYLRRMIENGNNTERRQ